MKVLKKWSITTKSMANTISKKTIGAGIIVLVFLLLVFIPVSQVVTENPTHTANTGELTQDSAIGQTFVAKGKNVSDIAIKFATYSGRTNTENVVMSLYTWEPFEKVREVTVPAANLNDNQLYRFSFDPIADAAGRTFFVVVTSPTSTKGNAVTVDIHGQDPYIDGTAFIIRGNSTSLDKSAIEKSGKPTIDLAFATYEKVSLWRHVIHQGRLFFRSFIAGWGEHKEEYGVWGIVLIPAIIFLLLVRQVIVYPREKISYKTVIFLIFIAAVLIRLVYAKKLLITSDEGNYLYDAWLVHYGTLAGGDGYVKTLLPILWTSMWQFMFGNTVFAGRLASVVAGALTVYPLYIIGREAVNKKVGMIMAAIWGLCGAPIVFTIYVHTQSVAILLTLTGIAVLWGTLNNKFFKGTAKGYLFAGACIAMGVISRKSMLAIGLTILLLIIFESPTNKDRIKRTLWVGCGFGIVLACLLVWAYLTYGTQGIWEALGVNSAEDGLAGIEPSELEKVRAYSIRGMTPIFREALPLIFLAVSGVGLVVEQLLFAFFSLAAASRRKLIDPVISYAFTKVAWIPSLVVYWWAWTFFSEQERGDYMVFGMRSLWFVGAFALVVMMILPRVESNPTFLERKPIRRLWTLLLLSPVWILSFVYFYSNWIKFHANYLGEFLPPLVVSAGLGVWGWYRTIDGLDIPRLSAQTLTLVKRLLGVASAVIILWGMFVANYVTYVFEHTGTFKVSAVQKAAAFAQSHIPYDQTIFTGAAVVPYVSGHRITLDIAHPRWYAYEFARKDVDRIGTFLPPAPVMEEAFHHTTWVLMDEQTKFSFLMEYGAIEQDLHDNFVSVQGIENGSNTLTFYKRVKDYTPAP